MWLGAGDADVERSIDATNKLPTQYQDPGSEEQKGKRGLLPGVSNHDLPREDVTRVLSLP